LIGDRYDGEITRYGVLRTYATRHGAGPFPTEDRALARAHDRTRHRPWRALPSPPDGVMRHAIEACGGSSARAHHLDALDRLERWQACVAYETDDEALFDREGDSMRLRLGPPRDLDHQARITQALTRVRPIYRELDTSDPIAAIEAPLDRRVRLASAGPSSRDARWIALS
jgi:adenylosuccinate synthase